MKNICIRHKSFVLFIFFLNAIFYSLFLQHIVFDTPPPFLIKLNCCFYPNIVSTLLVYNCVVITDFRIGTFGLLLVVTTSDDTSHGDTDSTTSILCISLQFWSFCCSFCARSNKNRRKNQYYFQFEVHKIEIPITLIR